MGLSSLSEKYINLPINFYDILSAIILSCILSIIVRLVYTFKHNDASSDWKLQEQFYLLGPIISIIMIFIGANLALSIGLVGSLSIIRFRSAIKSPMDLIYLLWVIAIGLGCGTLNFIHIISATFIISIIVIIKKIFTGREKQYTFQVLTISGDLECLESTHRFIVEQFSGSKQLASNLSDNTFESSFRVATSKDLSSKLIRLKNDNNLSHVSFINNEGLYTQ